jgi:dienelactone hydrolase
MFCEVLISSMFGCPDRSVEFSLRPVCFRATTPLMKTKGLVGAAIVFFSLSAHAADYAQLGPEATTQGALTPNGGATGGYLVVPKGKGPYPLVIASHGWSASADNQVGWAQHFASWGFVVAVPTFPNSLFPNAQTNEGIIAKLVQLYSDPKTASAAQGKVDPSVFGLEGHSAGGLATTRASAGLKPNATVLFDPVDDQANDGKPAYATLCGPVLALFAAPSSCNNNAGWSAFKSTTMGPLVTADVVGSNHCDGENAPRGACGPFCGQNGQGADPTRQNAYARYATAFLLANLKNDAAAKSVITQASSDAQLANVASKNAPNCASSEPTDAGTTTGDASTPPPKGDASTPRVDASVDPTQQPDGGNGFTEDGLSSQPGCSCEVRSTNDGNGLWAIALGALILGVRRRYARG